MKLNDKYKFVYPPIITAIMLCIIYAIKGIYPFGTNTIDYYDMAQQISAFYYHVFDFLRGEKNLFYDPYTAMSVNMAMSTSGCSHLSLFNLFFLFVKRDMLLESLSFFLMLKMMLMSLFMYVYIHARFKVEPVYEYIFSVGYAFCGYVLTLYMTIQWLDVAAMFPLLMYFLYKLLNDGEQIGYIVVLFLSIVSSYYQSFMILLYIILMVGVYVFVKKANENYHLLKLLAATVISLLLSMFILIPQIFQTLISARFNNESEGGLIKQYLSIVSTYKPAYTSRWWSLLLTSFALAIIAAGFIKYYKDKKVIITAALALFIILSELIVEGINLFWHFGSYVGYPIRNGYMLYFTIIVVACYFLEKMHIRGDEGLLDEDINLQENVASDETANVKKAGAFVKKDTFEKKDVFVVLALVVSLAIVVIAFIIYKDTMGLMLRNVFHLTSFVMAVTFLAYFCLYMYQNGKYVKLATILFAAEIILYGFIMIGEPTYTSGYNEDPEQEGDYIKICNQLDEKLSLNAVDNLDEKGESLLFSRVKNIDTSLNANYGLVLRRPCLSNWTHLLSPELQRDASKLGYSIQYTRLLDAGGTVFSDALIGVKNVISRVPLDDTLYELVDTVEVEVNHKTGEKAAYYYYNCKYTLPFGLITSTPEYDFENGDTVDIYNSLYASLIPENSEKIAQYESISLDNESTHISGKKALYYISDQIDTDDYNTEIIVNGEVILVSSIGEMSNNMYPAHFNNNALYLGTFKDEDVTVEISASDVDKKGKPIEGNFNPRVFSIDIDALEELINSLNDRSNSGNAVLSKDAKGSHYSFSVNSESDDNYLMLPFSYDKGYIAKVNGVKTEVEKACGLFSLVKLSKGENVIELKFIPNGMMFGVVASVIGVFLLIIYVYLDKKTGLFIKDPKWLKRAYLVGFSLALIFMFFVPCVFYVLGLFHIV